MKPMVALSVSCEDTLQKLILCATDLTMVQISVVPDSHGCDTARLF